MDVGLDLGLVAVTRDKRKSWVGKEDMVPFPEARILVPKKKHKLSSAAHLSFMLLATLLR